MLRLQEQSINKGLWLDTKPESICSKSGVVNAPIVVRRISHLQIEHIVPRAKGGSNRVSNLCLACEKCNLAKGTKSIEDFLKKKPDLLKKILAQAKAPLKDAAAVNATRWELFRCLQGFGIPYRVRFGRTHQVQPDCKRLAKNTLVRCSLRRQEHTRSTSKLIRLSHWLSQLMVMDADKCV